MPTWSRDQRGRIRSSGATRWLAAAAIALAAVGLGPGGTGAVEPTAQFDIFGFTLRLTNTEGEVTHVLQGERMQQFDTLGTQHAEQPRLELLTEGRVDWIWTAPAAVHFPAEQRLVLIGTTRGVQLPGPQNPRTEIETTDVTILTETREVMTDARATLVRPGLFMTGVGMHADANAETIELKSAVDTVYAPDETEDDSR